MGADTPADQIARLTAAAESTLAWLEREIRKAKAVGRPAWAKVLEERARELRVGLGKEQ